MLRQGSRPFVLPYEPEYSAHRTSEREQRKSDLLLHAHMNMLYSPPLAPDDLSDSEVGNGSEGAFANQG